MFRFKILFGIIILASVLIRLVNIDIPLFEMHSFRQTQTAITVQSYLYDGVSWFDYKTPVFGSETRIPFEFPIFQVTCYWVYKAISLITPISLDLACRFSNIIYFYFSAFMLYKFSRLIFNNKNISFYIVSVYLIIPFNVFWSRTSMIDYCSVFFSLSYAVFFVQWLVGGKYKYFFLAIVFGVVAYLSKVTTVLTVVPIIAYFTIKYLLNKKNFILEPKKIFFLKVSLFLMCVCVPLIAGLAWTHYTDYMKTLSHQEWLTSKSLSGWNFGTLEAKLSFSKWRVILGRIRDYFFPGLFLGIIPFAFFYSYYSAEERKNFIVIMASVGVTIFVFFNLYFVHDYYLIAVSPMLSIFIGFCLYNLVRYCQENNQNKILIVSLLLLCLSLGRAGDYWKLYFTSKEDYYNGCEVLRAAEYVKNITNRDDKILVMDNDWSSDFLYYAERTGYMIKGGVSLSENFDEYALIALKDQTKHINILSNFEALELLTVIGEWKIYKPLKWVDFVKHNDVMDKNDIFNIVDLLGTCPDSIKTSFIMRKMVLDNQENAIFFHPNAELVFLKSEKNKVAEVKINMLPKAFIEGNSDGVTFYWEAKEHGQWKVLNQFYLNSDIVKIDSSFKVFSTNIEDIGVGDEIRLRVDSGIKNDSSWDWAVIKDVVIK